MQIINVRQYTKVIEYRPCRLGQLVCTLHCRLAQYNLDPVHSVISNLNVLRVYVSKKKFTKPSNFSAFKMSMNQITIEDLKILKAPHVHMKDEALVLQKLNKIVREGHKRLQFVTDFDLTLTKQHEDGHPILSSFCIFDKCEQLPPAYKEEAARLYEKYRPIEINPNIPIERKAEAMVEWMIAGHKSLQGLEFDRKEIEKVTQLYGHSLRDRTKELFSKLKNLNVPVLVFSAGLGDIVKTLLRQQEVLHENVNIISNFLKFNGNTLDGFENYDSMIHVFNKNEHAVEHKYFKILQGRTNVILMGDSVGDATMADGVENTETILRIGFLYDRAEESLPHFKNAFDIVLVDDQTMNVVLEILRLLQ